jgi:VWFA-related protein
MRPGLSSVVVFLIAAALAGQFGETIEVRLHQLEVIVETREGVPVTSLGKDDFVVRLNGDAQAITNFSINVEAPDLATGEGQVSAPASAPAEPHVKKREDRRYVFFIDESPMHDLSREDFLRQSSMLLDAMSATDQAMVITPAAMKRVPLYFTTDKTAVQKTLARITAQMLRLNDVKVVNIPKPADYIDTGVPNEVEDPYFRRGDCGQSLARCSERRLSALRDVVQSLAALPGRKAVILMSYRISSDPLWRLNRRGGRPVLETGRSLKPLVQEVARIAADHNVMIYPIEPFEPGDAAMVGVVADERLAETPETSITRRGGAGVLDAFMEIAAVTGGRAFSGTREFDDLFGQVVRDQSFYYSIAFADRSKRGDGQSVTVELRNRPDLIVRTRRHVRTRTQSDELRDKALSAVLDAKPGNDLDVAVTIEAQKQSGRLIEVPFALRVPIRRLTMVRDGDAYRGSFTVYVAAQDTEQLALGDASQKTRQEVVIPVGEWDAVSGGHFTFKAAVRLKPGTYRMAVGAADGTSGDTGFQTFEVVAGGKA